MSSPIIGIRLKLQLQTLYIQKHVCSEKEVILIVFWFPAALN